MREQKKKNTGSIFEFSINLSTRLEIIFSNTKFLSLEKVNRIFELNEKNYKPEKEKINALKKKNDIFFGETALSKQKQQKIL